MRNLLDNSIRYTPAKDFDNFSIGRMEGQTRLIVKDSGPELSKVQRKLVVERFSRLSIPNGEGSGLGLSIVRRIADLHKASECEMGCRVELIFTQVSAKQVESNIKNLKCVETCSANHL